MGKAEVQELRPSLYSNPLGTSLCVTFVDIPLLMVSHRTHVPTKYEGAAELSSKGHGYRESLTYGLCLFVVKLL